MPTNLYGPNDNFDLERSHVLPALLRKIHLGKCLQAGNWEAIRKDLDLYPIEGVSGKSTEKEILEKLGKYGITRQKDTVKVEIWGSGKPMREFMYSEDMAAACVFMMENADIGRINSLSPVSLEPPRKIHFVNIGTGKEISIKGLAETIAQKLGFEGELFFNTGKPDGTMRKLCNVDLLHRLGFRHKTDLDEGIELMYAAYLEKQD